MINILIVEDSIYKMTTILKLLREDLMIEESYVDSAKNIKDAKIFVYKKTYDLLILDLVLPLEDGDDPAPENGVGFLNDINSNPNLNSPIHIIGLTEFGDLKSKFDDNFSSNLWHLINYNASEIDWQNKLKNVIHHLLSTRRNFIDKNYLNIDSQCDVAIITALNTPEFASVLALIDHWEEIKLLEEPTKFYLGNMSVGERKIRVLAACLDQMGMTATSNLSTKICIYFKPKYLFMAGICAGLREKDINYGDIIIAEQTWDYGSGKMKEVTDGDIQFEPDPRPIQLCPELKAKINAFLRRNDILVKIQTDWKSGKPSKYKLQAKLGPVASGSYVIASKGILDDIKNGQRKLLGVEMESYGLYYSAENTPHQYTKAIMIKSVSDYGTL